MSEDLISPAVYAQAVHLGREFQAARPFRHVVIDSFLKPNVADQLLAEFPICKEPDKLLNEFGDPNPKSAISDVQGIGGIYTDVDLFVQTPRFLNLIEEISSVPNLRYDPYYYG